MGEDLDLLDRLLGHDRWMTARLLERSLDLTDEQLDQPFEVGLGSVRATFDHMVATVDHWTQLMTGQTPQPKRREQRSIPELIERHERFYDTFEAAARKMVEEQRLDEVFLDHYNYPQSIGATIIQIPYHNTEHRTEALHMLRRLGVAELPDGDPQEWEHLTGRI